MHTGLAMALLIVCWAEIGCLGVEVGWNVATLVTQVLVGDYYTSYYTIYFRNTLGLDVPPPEWLPGFGISARLHNAFASVWQAHSFHACTIPVTCTPAHLQEPGKLLQTGCMAHFGILKACSTASRTSRLPPCGQYALTCDVVPTKPF